MRTFKIQIGNYTNKHEFIRDLEKIDAITPNSRIMLNMDVFEVDTYAREIELVVLELAQDLDFLEETPDWKIRERANELGFLKCPAEVGGQICLQCREELTKALFIYMEQLGTRLFMDPILGGCGGIFYLSQDDGKLRLEGGQSSPIYRRGFHPECQFVFMRDSDAEQRIRREKKRASWHSKTKSAFIFYKCFYDLYPCLLDIVLNIQDSYIRRHHIFGEDYESHFCKAIVPLICDLLRKESNRKTLIYVVAYSRDPVFKQVALERLDELPRIEQTFLKSV
ncbi:hypothetical protein KKG46_00825 [Patescibacteria group bacterium]|nr:hypothetical protein [Patescibacteria group bacterium]